MRSTSGHFSGHNILLLAATQGAVLSDGPASTSFRSGNPKYINSVEYEREQREVLRGRLEGKVNRYVYTGNNLLKQTFLLLRDPNFNTC